MRKSINKSAAMVATAVILSAILGISALAAEVDGMGMDVAQDGAASAEVASPDADNVIDVAERVIFGSPPGIPNEDPPVYPAEIPLTAGRPFTPAGTGMVVDNATDADGKEFYTITTPDENVFYLVIDKQRGQENVYFLNAVTEADLLPLAKMPPRPETAPVPATAAPEQSQTPAAPSEPDKATGKSGGNTGMIALATVAVALGCGAGWYLKIYKPKHQGAVYEDEYEPLPIEDGSHGGNGGGDEDGEGDGDTSWSGYRDDG